MSERDFTPTDAADAADDRAHREWWRRQTEPEFQDTEAEIWTAQQEQNP